MTYDHIAANDSRCWCAPQVFVIDNSVTQEVFPGIFVARLEPRTIVAHYEAALFRKRHGRPSKPKHIGEWFHV